VQVGMNSIVKCAMECAAHEIEAAPVRAARATRSTSANQLHLSISMTEPDTHRPWKPPPFGAAGTGNLSAQDRWRT